MSTEIRLSTVLASDHCLIFPDLYTKDAVYLHPVVVIKHWLETACGREKKLISVYTSRSQSILREVRVDTQAGQGLGAEAVERLRFLVSYSLMLTGLLIEPRPNCPRGWYPHTVGWALLSISNEAITSPLCQQANLISTIPQLKSPNMYQVDSWG